MTITVLDYDIKIFYFLKQYVHFCVESRVYANFATYAFSIRFRALESVSPLKATTLSKAYCALKAGATPHHAFTPN